MTGEKQLKMLNRLGRLRGKETKMFKTKNHSISRICIRLFNVLFAHQHHHPPPLDFLFCSSPSLSQLFSILLQGVIAKKLTFFDAIQPYTYPHARGEVGSDSAGDGGQSRACKTLLGGKGGR